MPPIKPAAPITLLFCAALFVFLAGSAQGERPFPKPVGAVNDFANVIPPSMESTMEALSRELLQKTGTALVVVSMPDIGGAEYNDYANRLYESWGIGKKGEDRGVLVFITIQERKMRIETGYGVEGILPDGLVGEIRDRYMIPYFRNDRFGEGLLNGTLAIAQVIAREAGVKLTGNLGQTGPQDKGTGSGLAILPVIVFLLVISMLVSRRRGGAWLLFLPFLMGGGRRPGGGVGGSFGGFGGGFGGFGGGMSGGGGAGGSF